MARREVVDDGLQPVRVPVELVDVAKRGVQVGEEDRGRGRGIREGQILEGADVGVRRGAEKERGVLVDEIKGIDGGVGSEGAVNFEEVGGGRGEGRETGC